MASIAGDEVERLKSHLQVYEGLLKDQAAEIASLKAEVAYLKRRLETQPEELKAANTAERSAPTAPLTPPVSTAGSMHDPFVIDEDEDDAGPSRPLDQATALNLPPNVPTKRSSSPSSNPEEFRDPELTASRARRWFKEEDSPRKKPKITQDQGIEVCRLTPRPAPIIEHSEPTPDPPDSYVQDDSYLSESPLPSLTPSRPGTPTAAADQGTVGSSRTDILVRSVSRELSYLDDAPTTSTSRMPDSQRAGSSRPHRRPACRVSTRDHHEEPSPTHDVPRSTAEPVDRLVGARRFLIDIADPSLLQVTVNRTTVANIFGGAYMTTFVRTAGRDFMYPKLAMNPGLPPGPGKPGLLYRPHDEVGWKGEVQTLFVGLREGEYKYYGQYRLTPAAPLTADEYRELSAQTQKQWAKMVLGKSKLKAIRDRITARLGRQREGSANGDSDEDSALTIKQVIRAYRKGEERLVVWKMECIGFDEAFLTELVSKVRGMRGGQQAQ